VIRETIYGFIAAEKNIADIGRPRARLQNGAVTRIATGATSQPKR
jgi:hypothetical protein